MFIFIYFDFTNINKYIYTNGEIFYSENQHVIIIFKNIL
nr:MAG TPA: hypothetical protein [Caudoviricetes sp.]